MEIDKDIKKPKIRFTEKVKDLVSYLGKEYSKLIEKNNPESKKFRIDSNIDFYLTKISLNKPDYIDECGGIFFDMRFWECSCNENWLKDKSTQPECEICELHHEDSPDARLIDLFDLYETKEAINKAAGDYWDKYKEKNNA